MDNQRENLELKKITIVDKVRIALRKVLGYREGKKFILDTKPVFRKYSDIELMKLATIEQKLKRAINENRNNNAIINGINKQETESLLQWVVQNAREAFEMEFDEQLKEASLLGCCGLGQGITGITLQNMNLSPRILNANPNLNTKAGRHAFVVVEIPILQDDGKISNKPYLVDTTYRQFFLRNEVTTSCGEYIKDNKFGGRVAPLAGYWLLHMSGGKQFAEEILSKGFIELTEENAKFYGDSFTLEEKEREDYSKVPTRKEMKTGISGKTYIENMLNPIREQEIDYTSEELESWNINTKTPGILKDEMNFIGQKNEENAPKTRYDRNTNSDKEVEL